MKYWICTGLQALAIAAVCGAVAQSMGVAIAPLAFASFGSLIANGIIERMFQ
jgi:L-cysteine desulfidase